MSHEVMRQALDALELARGMSYGEFCNISAAIDALRAALAAPEQEPVAWRYGASYWGSKDGAPSALRHFVVPLYATPPAAPSVPEVTDEMVEAAENYLRSILNGASLPRRYMRGILHAALSEKSAAPSVPAPGYCKHCKQYTIEDPLPASQWIACSEQLPDADIEVLAWVVGEPFWDGHCWIATYDGHGWNADEGRYALRGVTHWMDLPGEPGC